FRLTKAHMDEYLTEKVAEILKEYAMNNQTLGMAMDNASNNDKMLQELPHQLPPDAPIGTLFQIHYFGHIINLVVKAFLSLFDSSAKALKADGGDKDDNDDNIIEEDEAAEQDAGDWDKIAGLSWSI
ncbi:hypothetical protein BT96DRAFT_835427, partial [Gymnopus androsaceus JB14]